MRSVQDTFDEMQVAMRSWVLWAQRLEALVLANPVECHCWDNNGRNGSQGHIDSCAEWREVAASIRTKPNMSPGPVRDD